MKQLSFVLVVLFLPVFPAPAADEPKTAGPIAEVLEPYVKRGVLAGAVTLVADKEKVLDLEAVGFADIAAGRMMLIDLLFWIASESKPITAAALMMLVDEGKLKLDDPVEKFLPEFRDVWVAAEKDKDHVLLKRPSRKVTVRDVLSHMSGMPFRSAMEEPTLDQLTLKVGVKSYALTPLQSQPGEKYAYSNAGINTAGRIIEVVSGMSYEDFLQKRLFDPLGMKDTTFWPNEEQLKRLAKAYRPGKSGLEELKVTQLSYPLSDRKRQPMPAGGLFSTAADMGRFGQMMLNDGVFAGKRYLSEEAVREMTKRQTPATVKESYGLGWAIGGDGFGHGGAYATNLWIDRKRGLVLVYMVQHAGFPGDGAQAQTAFRKAAEGRFGKK